MADIKIFCQKRKRIVNSNTICDNIQSRYRNGIWHRKICHACNKKLQTTHIGRIRTSKLSSHQNACRKRKPTNTWGYRKVRTLNNGKWKKKKYERRARTLLETKLYSRNLVKLKNIWAVPLISHSGPFLKWTREKHRWSREQENLWLCTRHYIKVMTLIDAIWQNERERREEDLPAMKKARTHR